MSYRLIRRLSPIRVEFNAARSALELTIRLWPALHLEEELGGPQLAACHLAEQNIEATYVLRLFAEFEASLRGQYPHSRPGKKVPPNADGLINGLRSHYKIPAGHAARVHRIRLFRHSVAHAAPGAEAITFGDALSWLNQYLASIPNADVP